MILATSVAILENCVHSMSCKQYFDIYANILQDTRKFMKRKLSNTNFYTILVGFTPSTAEFTMVYQHTPALFSEIHFSLPLK